MSNDFKLSPTPIQRNKLDVATELTTMYISKRVNQSKEEIAQTFAQFYALVELCEIKTIHDLQNILSAEILEKIGRYEPNY